MIFEQIPAGGDRNFAYLLGDEMTKKGAVADPGSAPEKVLARAESKGLEVAYCINTHGHSDHTAGNDTVLSRTGAALITGYNLANAHSQSTGRSSSRKPPTSATILHVRRACAMWYLGRAAHSQLDLDIHRPQQRRRYRRSHYTWWN